MSLTNAIAAYADCESLFERALSNRVGTRALLPNLSSARLMTARMHHYRTLLRKESQRLYAPTDSGYGKSQYDGLMVRMTESAESDGTYWVYVERHGLTILEIEDLSEDPPDFEQPTTSSEQRALAYQTEDLPE